MEKTDNRYKNLLQRVLGARDAEVDAILRMEDAFEGVAETARKMASRDGQIVMYRHFVNAVTFLAETDIADGLTAEELACIGRVVLGGDWEQGGSRTKVETAVK